MPGDASAGAACGSGSVIMGEREVPPATRSGRRFPSLRSTGPGEGCGQLESPGLPAFESAGDRRRPPVFAQPAGNRFPRGKNKRRQEGSTAPAVCVRLPATATGRRSLGPLRGPRLRAGGKKRTRRRHLARATQSLHRALRRSEKPGQSQTPRAAHVWLEPAKGGRGAAAYARAVIGLSGAGESRGRLETPGRLRSAAGHRDRPPLSRPASRAPA